MTTNKKKQKKGAKQSASGSENGASPQEPIGPKDAPTTFTRAQMTAIVFLVMGVSRFLEWKRALHQVTITNAGGASQETNTTALVCQDYLLTNEEVDFDDVCDNPTTATLMSLKYDATLEMLVMVMFLFVQCWSDEVSLNRLVALLSMTPVSTTLLLLQAGRLWLNKRKSLSLTIMCGMLMFLSNSSTAAALRDLKARWRRPVISIGNICLATMAFLQLYEMGRWLLMSKDSSLILNVPDNSWHEAWPLFTYCIVADKFALAALLAFVWFCFDDNRQRPFLLVYAIWKAYEYSSVWTSYNEADFVNLAQLQTVSMTCTALSALAWFVPNPFAASIMTTPTTGTTTTSKKEN